ncbi:MAG: DUF1800 domain-containing protein [Pseudomonadota bacterium]
MSKTSIALNRFGYGLHHGTRAPSEPQADLLRQLAAFNPRPGALADRPDSSGEAGELIQVIRQQQRKSKQDAARAAEMSSAQEVKKMTREERIDQLPPELRGKVREAYGRLRADIEARVNVAVASPTPFAERLVHFWSNHFSVTAQKQGTPFEVGNHEFYAIRPNLNGRFSDMLKAAVLHPAMLLYLDQWQSSGPNSPFNKRRKGRGRRGLNENLAREIMELHTLGVNGGYSQADVTEFARALTGWTVKGLARIKRFAEPQSSGAVFIAAAHEPGSRQVMGRNYTDAGARQAVAILDDLAARPATARFLATKLARHFTSDTPPASLVTRLESDFLRTGGDLASLHRTLVRSPEPWANAPAKFRQPFEWLVSVMRFTGVETLGGRRTIGVLRQLGQEPWKAPSPAGFDDVNASWAGPDALLRRVELAERIARNAPADAIMERAQAAFPDALSEPTRTWLSRAESGHQALGLMLVSPEMMRR